MGSSITFDDTLQFLSNFGAELEEPEFKHVEKRTPTGVMNVYSQFEKDILTITFTKLSQTDYIAISKICRQVGINAFHKVEWITDEQTYKWDSSTAATSTINPDANRVRNKLFFQSYSFKPYPANPTIFSGTIQAIET